MPTRAELLDELGDLPRTDFRAAVTAKMHDCIKEIADITGRNVLYYASGFLHRPEISGLYTSISLEDVDRFMDGIRGLDPKKGLLLILHTPGGQVEASHAIIGYLRSKFDDIVALIPTYAMSAGTMIALACDSIIMGRHSQLGPIDPQFFVGGRYRSVHSIISQFEEAKQDILNARQLVHAWHPVLNMFGPEIQDARRAIKYGNALVEESLTKNMFSDEENPSALARKATLYFGSEEHGSHGRRIDRDEARAQGIKVVDLEDDQDLQEASLTLHHLSTLLFRYSGVAKFVLSSNGRFSVESV